MAAISTTMMALLSPGDHVISSNPVYGGTHYLHEVTLPRFGIDVHQVDAGTDTAGASCVRRWRTRSGSEKIKMLFLETPANPSNVLVDIRAVAELRRGDRQGKTGTKPVLVVDNTFLGPVFQRPSTLGADLTLYSATKFIGGHSDLIAGVVTGPEKTS